MTKKKPAHRRRPRTTRSPSSRARLGPAEGAVVESLRRHARGVPPPAPPVLRCIGAYGAAHELTGDSPELAVLAVALSGTRSLREVFTAAWVDDLKGGLATRLRSPAWPVLRALSEMERFLRFAHRTGALDVHPASLALLDLTYERRAAGEAGSFVAVPEPVHPCDPPVDRLRAWVALHDTMGWIDRWAPRPGRHDAFVHFVGQELAAAHGVPVPWERLDLDALHAAVADLPGAAEPIPPAFLLCLADFYQEVLVPEQLRDADGVRQVFAEIVEELRAAARGEAA